MKKFLKRVWIFALMIVAVISLNACSKTTKEIYLDDGIVVTKSFTLELLFGSASGWSDYNLSVMFRLTNTEYKTNKYNIRNVKLIKEKTNASYGVHYNKSVTIDAELSSNISFSATIPSDIEDDNYILSFEINSNKIILHLYNTPEVPDELREDRIIDYSINSEVVKTITVKDGRTNNEAYVYEFNDHLNHCNKWYYDSTFKKEYKLTDVITEDIILYGKETFNLDIRTSSSDLYAVVYGVNFTPSDGIIVIPEYYKNKEIAIGVYAIRDISNKKIYIPKTVRIIYNGNFSVYPGATIYYEGTQEEWENLFTMSSNIIKDIVVFNTKYNG